jgi:hypothetical protein
MTGNAMIADVFGEQLQNEYFGSCYNAYPSSCDEFWFLVIPDSEGVILYPFVVTVPPRLFMKQVTFTVSSEGEESFKRSCCGAFGRLGNPYITLSHDEVPNGVEAIIFDLRVHVRMEVEDYFTVNAGIKDLSKGFTDNCNVTGHGYYIRYGYSECDAGIVFQLLGDTNNEFRKIVFCVRLGDSLTKISWGYVSGWHPITIRFGSEDLKRDWRIDPKNVNVAWAIDDSYACALVPDCILRFGEYQHYDAMYRTADSYVHGSETVRSNSDLLIFFSEYFADPSLMADPLYEFMQVCDKTIATDRQPCGFRSLNVCSNAAGPQRELHAIELNELHYEGMEKRDFEKEKETTMTAIEACFSDVCDAYYYDNWIGVGFPLRKMDFLPRFVGFGTHYLVLIPKDWHLGIELRKGPETSSPKGDVRFVPLDPSRPTDHGFVYVPLAEDSSACSYLMVDRGSLIDGSQLNLIVEYQKVTYSDEKQCPKCAGVKAIVRVGGEDDMDLEDIKPEEIDVMELDGVMVQWIRLKSPW